MNEKVAEAMNVLKEHGFKYTKKREKILTYLQEKDSYVPAKEIYDLLATESRGVSYDTVYRNLRDFVELHLVEETELKGERLFRFHCCQGAGHHHHHHFICTNCGTTREIHICPMDFFQEQLEGCIITGHRFEILGLCDKCAIAADLG